MFRSTAHVYDVIYELTGKDYVAKADGVEHLVDRHQLTLFTREEYVAAFERAGLAVEVVDAPIAGRDRYIGTATD